MEAENSRRNGNMITVTYCTDITGRFVQAVRADKEISAYGWYSLKYAVYIYARLILHL
jgi:hypothetical protein